MTNLFFLVTFCLILCVESLDINLCLDELKGLKSVSFEGDRDQRISQNSSVLIKLFDIEVRVVGVVF